MAITLILRAGTQKLFETIVGGRGFNSDYFYKEMHQEKSDITGRTPEGTFTWER